MADKKGRVNEIIKRNLSEIIIYDIKNELTRYCSINGVFTTKDYSYCKVYVSHIDPSKNENLVNFLNKRKGEIRTMLSKKLDIYKTPALIFVTDTNIENINRIDKLVHDAQNSKMYTLKDYQNDQKKKLKNTYSSLLKEIKRSSKKTDSKDDIINYHLSDKVLDKLVSEYEFLDTDEIEKEKAIELNKLYFAISLKKLKDLASQVSFITFNAASLLNKKVVDYISSYFILSNIQDDNTTLMSLTISTSLIKRLRYDLLLNYVSKLNMDRLLNLIDDNKEKVIYEKEIKIIEELYKIDKNKVISYLSDVTLNEKFYKDIIKKLSSLKESKERDKKILLSLID